MSDNFTHNRTVAFVDIHAFKFILEKFQLQRIGEVFTQAINNADEYHKEDKIYDRKIGFCNRHIFSDAIYVYSSDDSEKGCISVIRYTHRILQLLIWNQIPARSAITFGESYISEEKNIRIGLDSFTRAYELEQAQDWIGGIIDSSVVSKFPKIFTNNDLEIIQYSHIPFKRHKIYQHLGTKNIQYAINWLYGIIEDPSSIKGPLPTIQQIFGDKITKKYKKTIKFVNHVLKSQRSKKRMSTISHYSEISAVNASSNGI